MAVDHSSTGRCSSRQFTEKVDQNLVPSSEMEHFNKHMREREMKTWTYNGSHRRSYGLERLQKEICYHYDERPNWTWMPPRNRSFRTNICIYGTKSVCVTITSEAAVAEEWLESRSDCMYGLDLEWRPNRFSGEDNKVALLQISTDRECLMLQMLFLDAIPQGLVNFLLDPDRKTAGVGICDDAKKLMRDYGLRCNGIVELTELYAQRFGIHKNKKMGLKTLARAVLGLTIQKPKRVTLSDWAKPMLDRRQIEYACIDAWASFAIYEKLMTSSHDQSIPALPRKKSNH